MLPEGYAIRELEITDAVALCDAYVRNREHLEPWEPDRAESFYTPGGQAESIRAALEARTAGTGITWVITHEAQIVGRLALSNVVRGILRSANLGYWIDGAHTGRGLATAAVETVSALADEEGLHRLEAGTMLENEASQAVLLRCGFQPIGTAPGLLFIRGAWRDHRLFQLILNDDPPA